MTVISASSLGGGPYQGYSPKQTTNNYKDSGQTMTRRILRSSWNGAYASGKVNGFGRITTPFRAVMNSGDFLSRQNYVCGGPNPTNASKPGMKGRIGSILSSCDTTGIPASSCNVKFVADSSDYVRFRREKTLNQNYNDSKNGGDEHNGSYVQLMAVRRA